VEIRRRELRGASFVAKKTVSIWFTFAFSLEKFIGWLAEP
jgi:hypothetical protein